MATERVVTGKKYRILSSVSDKVWDVISFFTKSSDVWNNNDKNLQTTVGSITGISSSLTSTSSTVAASAAAVKVLNDKIVELNDEVVELKSKGTVYYLGTKKSFNVSSIEGYENFTASNFIVNVSTTSTPALTASVSAQKNGIDTGNPSSSAKIDGLNSKVTVTKSYNPSTGVFTLTATLNCSSSIEANLDEEKAVASTNRSATLNTSTYLIVGDYKTLSR